MAGLVVLLALYGLLIALAQIDSASEGVDDLTDSGREDLISIAPGVLTVAVALIAFVRAFASLRGRVPLWRVVLWLAAALAAFALWNWILEAVRCTYFWRGFFTGSCRG